MNQEKKVVKSLRKKLVVIAIGGIILSSLSGCKEKEPVKDIDIIQETNQETTEETKEETTQEQTEEPTQESTEDMQEKDSNSLSGKMEAIYEGKPEEFPMLMGTELNVENMQWFLGTTELDFIEGYASEAMISSIAHSIVLVRFDSEEAATDAVDVLKTTVDPRKWICVGVEEDQVVIEAKGDLVVVILDPMSAELFHENFLNLE